MSFASEPESIIETKGDLDPILQSVGVVEDKVSELERVDEVKEDSQGNRDHIKTNSNEDMACVTIEHPEQEETLKAMDALKITSLEKEKAYPMLDGNETKTIISKYLSMAVKGKSSQTLLLQDPEIYGFLVLCIMDDSADIVECAFEVFEVLLCNRNNISALQNLPYFVDTLKKIAKNTKKLTAEIRNDATKMLQKLLDTRRPLGENSNTSRNLENNNPKQNQGRRVRKSDMGSAMNRSKQSNGKETILFLDNAVLQQVYDRQRISNTLIKVTGIISVTYNPNRNTCIIRGKRHVPSDNFASAVASLGYQVSLVFKNEKKEEVMIPVVVDKNDGSVLKENLPEYLPEEDEVIPVDDNAVSKSTGPGKKDQNEPSWWGSAKTFVSSSFYW